MKIHELLADPKHWIKNHMARDANGVWTSPKSDSAACWCLAGAAVRCYAGPQPENQLAFARVRRILDEAVRARGYLNVPVFNDDVYTTHDKVLALVKELDL